MKIHKAVLALLAALTLVGCSNQTTLSYHEPTPNDMAATQNLAHRFMLGETCSLGFNMNLPNYSTQPQMQAFYRHRSPGASIKKQLIYSWGQRENMPQCGLVAMTIKDPGPEGLQAYDFWFKNMQILQQYMHDEVRANTSPNGEVNMPALYAARDAAADKMARNATAIIVRPLFEFSDPTITFRPPQ